MHGLAGALAHLLNLHGVAPAPLEVEAHLVAVRLDLLHEDALHLRAGLVELFEDDEKGGAGIGALQQVHQLVDVLDGRASARHVVNRERHEARRLSGAPHDARVPAARHPAEEARHRGLHARSQVLHCASFVFSITSNPH